jgi:neutral trehalase
VQDYVEATGLDALIEQCYDPLVRQLAWFEQNRRATGEGFYYTDILNHKWESGIDEGVRFDAVQPGPFACVDATSHLYALYTYAHDWGERLGRDGRPFAVRADEIRCYIQDVLYDVESGFFYDSWAMADPGVRHVAFEGMWPVVVGAATLQQTNRVIDEYLLNARRFCSVHPICTVGVEDPLFELRMWRGPTWNSMTYWAARGCVYYDRPDAARRLLERALDASSAQYERTGTVWEFYHPHGGSPLDLQRKPHTRYNTPCRDYLGHNPLIAMARLYDNVADPSS